MVLAEGPDLIPHPHGGSQLSKLQFQGIQHPLLTSAGTRYTMAHLHMCKQNICTQQIKLFLKMVMIITIGRFFYLKSWREGSERGYSLTKPFFYWQKHSTVFAVILYKASALINSNLFEDRYFIMHHIQLDIFVANLLNTIGFEELFIYLLIYFWSSIWITIKVGLNFV